MISEALEAIESAVSIISIQDPLLIAELEPVEKLWMAARFHGKAWDILTEQFEKGEITVELYRDCSIQLIKEFGSYCFNRNIEKLLVQIQST